MEKTKENLTPANKHSGHRKRMREMVDKVGLENLNEIQALEFTLSYVLPRKNTNEIAHDLLKKFGNFYNVLNAPIKELESVNQMGKDSAVMLSQMKQIFHYYKINSLKQNKKIENILQLNQYFYTLLENLDREHLYVIGLNDNNTIVTTKLLGVGTCKLINLEKRDLADFAFTNKVKRIALAHNHPVATCNPSKSDDESTSKIKAWLNTIGVELLDHVIVGNDGSFSFKLVNFFSNEELENKAN